MTELRDQVLSWIREDEEKLVRFYADFVRAKSPNPPGDTRAAIEHVSRFLKAEGLPFRIVAPQETMPNIVGSFEGAKPGRHLVLNGHADVFPAGREDAWERDPWCGEIVDGRMFGRGSADMKAGTTAAIFAYAYLARLKEKLAGRLTLMVVSDEETGGRWGSRYLLETMEKEVLGDCVLSGEPGGVGTVRFGEKGILQLAIEVRTRGAHGPYPHLSPSAIRIAGAIMSELDALTKLQPKLPESVSRCLAAPEARDIINRTMGEGTADVMTQLTVNIGTISGGTKVNMIAADCVMEVDIRIPIGIDRDEVIGEVKKILARHPESRLGEITGNPSTFSEPEHEMTAIIGRNVVALGKPAPVAIPALGGSDCRFWRQRGVPSYVYGPSPRNVSAPNESVSVEDFLHVVRVHALSALDYLAGKPQ